MEIDSYFEKNSDFRTVQITGAFGGVMGNGMLNMSLYTERLPIPTKVVMQINTETNTVQEKHREGKTGILREFQIGVLMDLNATRDMYNFLGNSIKQQEQILGITSSTPPTNEQSNLSDI